MWTAAARVTVTGRCRIAVIGLGAMRATEESMSHWRGNTSSSPDLAPVCCAVGPPWSKVRTRVAIYCSLRIPRDQVQILLSRSRLGRIPEEFINDLAGERVAYPRDFFSEPQA